MRRGERVRASTVFAVSDLNLRSQISDLSNLRSQISDSAGAPVLSLDKIPALRLRYSFVLQTIITFLRFRLPISCLRLPHDPQTFARQTSHSQNFCLFFMGFIFGGVIAEIALRVAGYSYPEFYQPDEVCGVSLRPGAEGWYRKEGEAYVRINSDGLRDQEHALTKPPDTFRIAVIGDSYCEAFSVPMEEAFWSVMRTKLQECGAFAARRLKCSISVFRDTELRRNFSPCAKKFGSILPTW